MKIINITNTKFICELSQEELNSITAKRLYRDDFIKMFKDEVSIDVSTFCDSFKLNEEYKIKSAIESLESASNFLKCKFNSLESIKQLKGKQNGN
jgi:hypothetical protein